MVIFNSSVTNYQRLGRWLLTVVYWFYMSTWMGHIPLLSCCAMILQRFRLQTCLQMICKMPFQTVWCPNKPQKLLYDVYHLYI